MSPLWHLKQTFSTGLAVSSLQIPKISFQRDASRLLSILSPTQFPHRTPISREFYDSPTPRWRRWHRRQSNGMLVWPFYSLCAILGLLYWSAFFPVFERKIAIRGASCSCFPTSRTRWSNLGQSWPKLFCSQWSSCALTLTASVVGLILNRYKTPFHLSVTYSCHYRQIVYSLIFDDHS